MVQIPSCRFHRANSTVQVPSCAAHCAFYCAGSIVQIPWCRYHRADSIVQIPWCTLDSVVRAGSGFHHAQPIVRSIAQVLLCRFLLPRFHRARSIVRIPSCRFHRADFFARAYFIVRILLCGFHRAYSIVRNPLCVIHCAHSIVCIPSCVFHRMHSIVHISSYRRRRGEVKGGRGAAHCIHIYVHN